MADPAPIDAVYTWVDGTRPEYLDLVRQYAAQPRDVNPERFRDAFETLRFSLRGLEQHAPWVRHIYLFTRRPHVPAWLKRDHPRLRIVHHDEVITEPDVMPTFNSNVIETFLDRLPGIAEHFIYLNDDYLFGAPVPRERFMLPDGRFRVFGTLCGERLRRRVYEHRLISLGLLEHGPILIERGAWREMQERARDDIAETHRHRFRSGADVRPERLYRWHLLTHARRRVVVEPFWRYLRYSAFHKIRHDPARERTQLGRILRRRPQFICLNDDQRDNPNPEVIATVRSFLREMWPAPSSFELPA
jgi:hypothetical protein